jgi:catechol-2,3-dioxygenase
MKIQRLKLYSGNIDAQKQFYTDILKFKVLKDTPRTLHFQVGESVLIFEKTNEKPYYHFAINIPSNQISEAIKWLKEKVPLLKWQGKEIVDFPKWNAQGVYFYDKDNNIVELIARKELDVQSTSLFSEKSLLHLSEIGVATTDVLSIVETLKKEHKVDTYDGDSSRFNAAGSETGLFIIVNRKEKNWIPNMDEAKPFPFEVSIENKFEEHIGLRFENEQLIKLI